MNGLPERVVCAAVKCSTCGTLILGVRHFDSCMEAGVRECMGDNHARPIQGFVTNRWNFVTREQAWGIAQREGQIIRRCGGGEGRLYSENLY